MTQATIARNIDKVLQEKDVSLLSPETYRFITLHMGHIAHYDRLGFVGTYKDLRLLCHSLQTSEYSNDPEYNLKWAEEYVRRGELDTASTIRRIIGTVRLHESAIDKWFSSTQREEELATANAIAGKYGYKLVAET